MEFDLAAKAQRQRVNIAIHVDGERTVVTGIKAEAWHGPFPAAMVPIIGISTAKAQRAPAGGKIVPKSPRRPAPVMRPVPPSMAAPGRPQPKQSVRPGKGTWRP